MEATKQPTQANKEQVISLPAKQQISYEEAKKVVERHEKEQRAKAFLNWDIKKGLMRSKEIVAEYNGDKYRGFQYSNSDLTTLLIKGENVLKTAWEGVKIVSTKPLKA
jgi:hypothetical protein